MQKEVHRDKKQIRTVSYLFTRKVFLEEGVMSCVPSLRSQNDEGRKDPSIEGVICDLGESIGTQWKRLVMSWEMRWTTQESGATARACLPYPGC